MFEDQQSDAVEAFKNADANFRRLYQRHKELDSKVHDAEIGVLPIDDVKLHAMKVEKLQTKDKLQKMWDDRQQKRHIH